MIITVTYTVEKDLYSAAEHHPSLITTEYICKNELLVHLQIGKRLGIRLNNRLGDLLPEGIRNEQFLFKKTYNQGDSKLITRSTFEAKIKRLDTSHTVVEQEILEDYVYIDKNGCSDKIQVVITMKEDAMTAVIDFNSTDQLNNFVCPAWLTPHTSEK